MGLKFLSIDIETTGLSISNCLVLQIGVVAVDTDIGIMGDFECNILHSKIWGEPFALNMNKKLIEDSIPMLKLSGRDLREYNAANPNKIWVSPETAGQDFMDYMSAWLDTIGFQAQKRYNIAGKNVAKFDIPFLESAEIFIPHRHRLIDPAILYYKDGDETLPDLKQLLERVGVSKAVAHTAVEDATDVANLILHKLSNISVYPEDAIDPNTTIPEDCIIPESIDLHAYSFRNGSGKMQLAGTVSVRWDDPAYFPWSENFKDNFLELVKKQVGSADVDDSVIIVDHSKYDECEWYNRCYTHKIR